MAWTVDANQRCCIASEDASRPMRFTVSYCPKKKPEPWIRSVPIIDASRNTTSISSRVKPLAIQYTDAPGERRGRAARIRFVIPLLDEGLELAHLLVAHEP